MERISSYLNGSLLLTETEGANPSGNAGFRVKSTTSTAVTGLLEDIQFGNTIPAI
jgi:hypothetical protein